MSKIISAIFGKSKRQPRRNLTLFEALDLSLTYGYSAVEWGRW